MSYYIQPGCTRRLVYYYYDSCKEVWLACWSLVSLPVITEDTRWAKKQARPSEGMFRGPLSTTYKHITWGGTSHFSLGFIVVLRPHCTDLAKPQGQYHQVGATSAVMHRLTQGFSHRRSLWICTHQIKINLCQHLCFYLYKGVHIQELPLMASSTAGGLGPSCPH